MSHIGQTDCPKCDDTNLIHLILVFLMSRDILTAYMYQLGPAPRKYIGYTLLNEKSKVK